MEDSHSSWSDEEEHMDEFLAADGVLPRTPASGGSGADEAKLRVRFRTRIPRAEWVLPESVFEVPGRFSRFGLSEVVNHLLELDPSQPFDFLINGEFLRTSLQKYAEAKSLLEEVIDVEYVPALAKPEPKEVKQHDDWIACIETNAQFGIIVTGSYDGSIRVMSCTNTFPMLLMKRAHAKAVTHVCITCVAANGASLHLLSSSKDQTLRVWKVTHLLTQSPQYHQLTTLTAHEASVLYVDAQQQQQQQAQQPQNQLVFCSSGWDNVIQVWDVNVNTLKPQRSHGPSVDGDGDDDEDDARRTIGTRASRWCVVGDKRDRRAAEADAEAAEGAMTKDDVDAIVPVFRMTGHSQAVSCAQWLRSDAEKMLSGSWDHSLRLWDVPSGVATTTFKCGKVVTSLSQCSTSNNVVVTGHHDNAIRLWDTRTSSGSMITRSFVLHSGWVTDVNFHPQKEHLFISSSHDKTVKLWDTRSNIPLHTVTTHEDKVLSCAFLPTDETMFIYSGGVDTKLKQHQLNDWKE